MVGESSSLGNRVSGSADSALGFFFSNLEDVGDLVNNDEVKGFIVVLIILAVLIGFTVFVCWSITKRARLFFSPRPELEDEDGRPSDPEFSANIQKARQQGKKQRRKGGV